MSEPVIFHAFGRDHLLTLGLLCLLSAIVVRAGRRWSPPQQARLGLVLALLLVGYAAAMYTQLAMAGALSPEYALPLELCHWVLIACAVSLIRPHPLATEMAYFFGLAGTLQATLTPEIGEGFPSWEFIQFFWIHGAILLAVIFFIACRSFRPRPRSVARMFVAVNVYALSVGAVNAIFGWNYGYLCSKPARPSLLDLLGPWPWYLLSLELIALANFWLLDLPWRLRDRITASRVSGR